MGMQNAAFLGEGFPFPLCLEDGELCPASGEEKLNQSIYTIIMTRQGERPLRPDFGSRIWEYVFELPGETSLNLMRGEIVRAVSRWEHRVDDVACLVDTSLLSKGKLMVTVTYRVRATNHPGNLVFPFYLEEGQW